MFFYMRGEHHPASPATQIHDFNPEGTRIHGPFESEEQALRHFEQCTPQFSRGVPSHEACILFEGRLVERRYLPERVLSVPRRRASGA